MADLERRRSLTPRQVREQRAYRLVVAGGVTGTLGVVGIVLAAVGVIGNAGLPILLLIVAALCAVGFQRTVSGR